MTIFQLPRVTSSVDKYCKITRKIWLLRQLNYSSVTLMEIKNAYKEHKHKRGGGAEFYLMLLKKDSICV